MSKEHYSVLLADDSVDDRFFLMRAITSAAPRLRVTGEVQDGEELIARGRVLRSGKTLKVCTADIYARKKGAETHCATMLATVMCLGGQRRSTGRSVKLSSVSSSDDW